MKVDVREIYLKQLLGLERASHRSFKTWLQLALLFLQEPGSSKDAPEVKRALGLVMAWLEQFETEKGVPALDYVLYEMDLMSYYGKGVLRVRTKFTRKKFEYPELVFGLEHIEDEIMGLIRRRAAMIRISDPVVAAATS